MPFSVPAFLQTKKFILASSALTLTLYLCLLLLIGIAPLTSQKSSSLPVKAATPQSIKKNFATPLKEIQSGKGPDVWVQDGFTIIDIRPRSEFDKMHIKGAQTAPVDQLQESLFLPNTTLVVYTDNQADADAALQILNGKNLKGIETLVTPLDALKSEGYELEATAPKL
jgi:rhodanese-related sulfurtransferase